MINTNNVEKCSNLTGNSSNLFRGISSINTSINSHYVQGSLKNNALIYIVHTGNDYENVEKFNLRNRDLFPFRRLTLRQFPFCQLTIRSIPISSTLTKWNIQASQLSRSCRE